MTRSGATTNPEPSSARWQVGAMPLMRSTLGCRSSATGLASTLGSGGSTSATGVRPNGPMTSGRPEVSSSAENSFGTPRNQSGASTSTVLSTRDPRTAAEISGWDEAVSGMASSHAATSTATACRPAPTTLSTPRATGLCMLLRAARPSTMPATSPMMTRTTMSAIPARIRIRPSSTCTSTCGAIRMPATAPSTTPRNASADATAPCRRPDDAATSTTSRMSRSIHPDGVTVRPPLSRARRA